MSIPIQPNGGLAADAEDADDGGDGAEEIGTEATV